MTVMTFVPVERFWSPETTNVESASSVTTATTTEVAALGVV